MKLTNDEVFKAQDPLGVLLKERLPVKVSYGLAKMAKKLNDQYEVIEQVRTGLIYTYGEPDPTDSRHTMVTPQCKDFEKFQSEFKELMDQEVELVIDKVTLP